MVQFKSNFLRCHLHEVNINMTKNSVQYPSVVLCAVRWEDLDIRWVIFDTPCGKKQKIKQKIRTTLILHKDFVRLDLLLLDRLLLSCHTMLQRKLGGLRCKTSSSLILIENRMYTLPWMLWLLWVCRAPLPFLVTGRFFFTSFLGDLFRCSCIIALLGFRMSSSILMTQDSKHTQWI